VRYLVDVMAGLPAIVAGLFVLSIWVIGLHRGDTGLAGALALFVVELPVIVRSSEEILKLVPDSLREASLALGVARWRTILRVVVPTALPGMLTGIMLAVARVAGETAPILLVVGVTDNLNTNVFSGQQANLALYVFDNAGLPEQTAVNRAWTGALTLVLLVLLLSVIARLLARRFSRR
jgi:phosphate transport system permease protein